MAFQDKIHEEDLFTHLITAATLTTFVVVALLGLFSSCFGKKKKPEADLNVKPAWKDTTADGIVKDMEAPETMTNKREQFDVQSIQFSNFFDLRGNALEKSQSIQKEVAQRPTSTMMFRPGSTNYTANNAIPGLRSMNEIQPVKVDAGTKLESKPNYGERISKALTDVDEDDDDEEDDDEDDDDEEDAPQKSKGEAAKMKEQIKEKNHKSKAVEATIPAQNVVPAAAESAISEEKHKSRKTGAQHKSKAVSKSKKHHKRSNKSGDENGAQNAEDGERKHKHHHRSHGQGKSSKGKGKSHKHKHKKTKKSKAPSSGGNAEFEGEAQEGPDGKMAYNAINGEL